MKKILLILIFALLGCNQKKEAKKPINENQTTELLPSNNLEIKQDVKANNICKEFLTSYETNYDKIYEKDFINYEGNFSINFSNLNYFIDTSLMSKFFTENYISSFKNKIRAIDENLKKIPQSDGSIEGLEADVFLLTQDIEENLNQIRLKKIIYKPISNDIINADFNNGHVLVFNIKLGKIDSISIGD